jgi:hypothetical protein
MLREWILPSIRRAKRTEKPLFGGLQGYASGVSEAFRTVSEEVSLWKKSLLER